MIAFPRPAGDVLVVMPEQMVTLTWSELPDWLDSALATTRAAFMVVPLRGEVR